MKKVKKKPGQHAANDASIMCNSGCLGCGVGSGGSGGGVDVDDDLVAEGP